MSISSASAILISDDSSSGIDALQLGGESIKKIEDNKRGGRGWLFEGGD